MPATSDQDTIGSTLVHSYKFISSSRQGQSEHHTARALRLGVTMLLSWCHLLLCAEWSPLQHAAVQNKSTYFAKETHIAHVLSMNKLKKTNQRLSYSENACAPASWAACKTLNPPGNLRDEGEARALDCYAITSYTNTQSKNNLQSPISELVAHSVMLHNVGCNVPFLRGIPLYSCKASSGQATNAQQLRN